MENIPESDERRVLVVYVNSRGRDVLLGCAAGLGWARLVRGFVGSWVALGFVWVSFPESDSVGFLFSTLTAGAEMSVWDGGWSRQFLSRILHFGVIGAKKMPNIV